MSKIGFIGGSVVTERLVLNGMSVLVDADNKVIDVSRVGRVNLSSDDPNATQRTMLLTEPNKQGLLVLVFDGSGGIQLVDNSAISGGSGLVRLSGNWTVNSNQATLTLIFDGLDWQEIARSINN